MVIGVEAEEREKAIDLRLEPDRRDAAQTADEPQVLGSREVGVDVCLLRHVSNLRLVGDEIVLDVRAVEQHPAV